MALNAIVNWFRREPSGTRPKRDLHVSFAGLPGIPEERESSAATTDEESGAELVTVVPPIGRPRSKTIRGDSRPPSLDDQLPQDIAFVQEDPAVAGPSLARVPAEGLQPGPSQAGIPAESLQPEAANVTTPLLPHPRRSVIAKCCNFLFCCLCSSRFSEPYLERPMGFSGWSS